MDSEQVTVEGMQQQQIAEAERQVNLFLEMIRLDHISEEEQKEVTKIE
jgi:hypothetical protein